VVVTAASSTYLFAYYQIMNHRLPWNISDPGVRPTWSIWGVIPWAVLVGLAVTTFVRGRIASATRELEPADGFEPTTC
jgi:hypothetical protein